MEQLRDAWTKLEQASLHAGFFDPRELTKAIRGFLERPSIVNTEEILSWSRELFKSPLPLDDILLLVWQVLYTAAPLVADLEDAPTTWMRLGKMRARILLGLVQDSDLDTTVEFLWEVVEAGGLDSSLMASIIELANRVASIQMNVDTRMLRILEEVSGSKDDLVLHTMRTLILTLYHRVTTEQRHDLDRIVKGIDAEGKMYYLLMKDLLEANIEVDTITNPSLSPLLSILATNKALASSIAECIVLLVKLKDYSLEGLIEKDESGYLGIFLFPKLVRKLPQQAIQLLSSFESTALDLLFSSDSKSDFSHSFNEDPILHYCSLYGSIIGGGVQCPPLNLQLVKKGLIGHNEVLCNRAFSCLCRSRTMEMSFCEGEMIMQFIIDAQLRSSSDSRQQTVASLKQLVETHYLKIYSMNRAMLQGEDETMKREINNLETFWRRVVQLSLESLTEAGFYNKNDLCIKILICVVDMWKVKLTKVTASKLIEPLNSSFENIIAPLKEADFLDRMCQCICHNSFDTVRADAAKLLCILDVKYPFDQDEYYSRTILPALSQQRAHVIDGATKLLRVYCEAKNNHREIIKCLFQSLCEQVIILQEGDSRDLACSPILGILSGLCILVDWVTNEECLELCNICRAIGEAVTLFVSHPTPEGHSVNDEVDEEEDLENLNLDDEKGDISFSVMTFCWRAIKESSALLAACLQKSVNDPNVLRTNGLYLIGMLLKTRHPGAFRSLAKPLRDVCQICFSSEQSKMIPDELLTESMDQCILHPEVQTTRRSAGLPICISSIVAASSDSLKRGGLLTIVFDRLLLEIPRTTLEGVTPGAHVVHTLNILRQIFRDTTLANDVIKFIPKGYSTCFQAFHSPNWSVRNSAMMLFVSLMNRTFGVRHDVDEYAACNLMDVRILHSRCPSIIPQITQECNASLDLLTKCSARYQVEFALYPLLSFIQRIRFSFAGERKHAEFYNAVTVFCLRSLDNDIMKVRKMTARLIGNICTSPLILDLTMRWIYSINVQEISCNQLHGYLLLLKALEGGGLLKREAVAKLSVIPQNIHCHPLEQAATFATEQAAVVAVEQAISVATVTATTINLVQSREMNYEEISLILPKVVQMAIQEVDESLFKLLESFWTDYDLAGSYRYATVSSFRPIYHPAARRIHYLALTDDDPEIRLLASDGRFGLRASVPHSIRLLLEENLEDIRDLIDSLPTNDQVEAGRRGLFEAEPLNNFKDPMWERRLIKTK